MPNGQYDPTALNVQMDLFPTIGALPNETTGVSTLTIEGVDFSSLQLSTQYSGLQIIVSGGMKTPGLPLVSPSQSGILLRGFIYQSFGNWIGTDMNINFIIRASSFTNAVPGFFHLNCPAGTMLTTAIQNMLSIPYPGVPVSVNIANPEQYIYNRPITHNLTKFGEMSAFVKRCSKSASSPGIQMVYLAPTQQILLTDGSIPGKAIQLNFTDLIGQPQWVGGGPTQGNPYILQFITVMRADIQVQSLVKMPTGIAYGPGSVTTTPGANPTGQLKLASAFQGECIVQSVRHIGNFRDSSGTAWVTVFQAATQPQ